MLSVICGDDVMSWGSRGVGPRNFFSVDTRSGHGGIRSAHVIGNMLGIVW
jgi:hypothetical protein